MRKSLLAVLLFASITARAQYYSITCDSQNPTEEYVIDSVFSGNTPFLRSYHYDNGAAVDMTPWTMEFVYSYGQYDTNGVVQIAGVVDLTNRVTFLGATNIFFQPFDKYYFSIKGTHSSGYVKTFATGRMIQRYDPATATNLPTLMGQINMDWWTNNVGTQVESNRVQIAVLVTGKVDQVDFDGTNAAFEVRIASNEEFRVTTQPATNAALLAHIEGNTAAQANTNAGFEVRIASNETFRITTQPATNAELQAQITANFTNQAGTNAEFEIRISSNEVFRLAQVDTNAAFQALLDALANTNTVFGLRITSNELAIIDLVATDVVFQALFDAQANTNAALLLQITNNLATLNATNAALAIRIGSNETFRITTQPATNAVFRALFTAQANTNADFEARIGSNDTFRTVTQPATNAAFNLRIMALEGGSVTNPVVLTNRVDGLIVADLDLVDADISGLADATYTGSLTTVAYTGTTAVAQNHIYIWGYTKQNAFGTSVLTLGEATLTATNAGAAASYFVAESTNTEMVLTLTGTGSSKSDVSDIYVQEVTNGILRAVEVNARSAQYEQLMLPRGAINSVYGQVWTLTNADTGAGGWIDAGAYGTITIDANTGWLIPYSNAWGAGWLDYGTGLTNEGNPLFYAEHDNILLSGQFLQAEFVEGSPASDLMSCNFALPDTVIQGLEIKVDWGGKWITTEGALTGYTYYVVGSVTSDITTFTNTMTATWITNTIGNSSNLLGLSQEDFTNQTNITVSVYVDGEFGASDDIVVSIDAISLRVYYQNINRFGITDEGRFVVITYSNGVHYVVEEVIAMSNRMDTINSNVTDMLVISQQVTEVVGDFASHSNNTANPHGVTPAQISALAISSNLLDVADAAVARSNLNAVGFDDLPAIVPQTNQVIMVDGTPYTITNKPDGTELHELVLDPVTTTAYTRAQSITYQPYSSTVDSDSGIATIAYSNGSLVKIVADENTTITFNNAAYPTNGVNRVALELWAGEHTISFASATISTNYAPTIGVNSNTSLYFRKTETNLWTIQGGY